MGLSFGLELGNTRNFFVDTNMALLYSLAIVEFESIGIYDSKIRVQFTSEHYCWSSNHPNLNSLCDIDSSFTVFRKIS